MVFDGQQIYFETGVRSDSLQKKTDSNVAPTNTGQQTTTTRTDSAALSITLNRRIDFTSRETPDKTQKLEAVELVMVGWLQKSECAFPDFFSDAKDRRVHVATGNYDVAGEVVSNQEIYAPRATFDVQSGQARCKGPGTVLARQRGGDGKIGINTTTQNNTGAGSAKSKWLQRQNHVCQSRLRERIPRQHERARTEFQRQRSHFLHRNHSMGRSA